MNNTNVITGAHVADVEEKKIIVRVGMTSQSHKSLAGKSVTAYLDKIIPNGGILNSKVLIEYKGQKMHIRCAELDVSSPEDRKILNAAIKKALNPPSKEIQNFSPQHFKVPLPFKN
jgi:hypothetical protein